jgi:hypothetical protein
VGEGRVQVGAMTTERLAPCFCIRDTTAPKLRRRAGWHHSVQLTVRSAGGSRLDLEKPGEHIGES